MPKRRFGPIGMMLAVFLLGGGARGGQVSPRQRLVWAHAMIVFPLDLDVVKPWLPDGYEGALSAYPLDVRRNWPRGDWTPPDVRSAKAAGLDGFSVDVFADGNAADGYLAAADAVGGFHIAACLDGGTDEQIVKAVSTYCEGAAGHRSAAKVGDAFVIFTYGTSGDTRGDNRPQRWRKIRDELARQGHKTWWMPDLAIDPGKPDWRETTAAYFPVFEGGYSFGSAKGALPALAALYRRNGKAFAGGMMPGYFRPSAGYEDARGTATYRTEWKRHLAVGPDWVHVATWNDLGEATEIMPNSDFNLTRADVTAWFASKFRGEPAPWKAPRLYVTTPKTAYVGQRYAVEGLVLNPLGRRLRVEVRLLDAGRKPFGKPVAAIVEPGADGAATLPLRFAAPPPGRFVRARATLYDGAKVVSTVLSAPIAALDPAAQPGFATLYYSVPARQALPGEVGIEFDRRPAAGKTARVAPVAPPRTQVQFSEVLFNDEILKNHLAEMPAPLGVPLRRKTGARSPDGAVASLAGEIKGGTEWGFYMARVTDARYRVGYSDPVYVAPPADLALKERYPFDEGAGGFANDRSPFRRVGELRNAEWIRPGYGAEGGALAFNGHDSRFDLAPGQTPTGPLWIKMVVRPRAYEGHFFCDSGGMWTTTTREGNVRFTRLGPQGWATATSKAKLPLGQWTPLEFRWDGATLRIFVNGRLDGEAPCAAKFGSGRRALGCNPFGGSSAFYEGDLDDFEIGSR